MVVGDSLSQGEEGDFTWRYRLWQHLEGDKADVAFTGPLTYAHDIYSGRNHAQYRIPASQWESAHDSLWGQTLGWELPTIADEVAAATPKPDILLVELGINDLAHGTCSGASDQRDIADVLSELTTFLGKVRAVAPRMRFLVADDPGQAPFPAWPQLPRLGTEYNEALAAFLPAHSTPESPVYPVDLTTAWDPRADTHDGVHPNEVGEWLLARDFGNALADDLGIGTDFPVNVPANLPTLHVATPRLRISEGAGTSNQTLSWTRSFGATGYTLYSRDVTAGTPYTAMPFAVPADHWSIGFAVPDHTYAYEVRADRGDGSQDDTSSGRSNEVRTVDDTTASTGHVGLGAPTSQSPTPAPPARKCPIVKPSRD